MLAALLDLSGFPFCEKRDNRRWNKWKQGKNVLIGFFWPLSLLVSIIGRLLVERRGACLNN